MPLAAPVIVQQFIFYSKMKKFLAMLMLCAFASMTAGAQEVKQLPQPDLTLNVTLMDALKNRKTDREFSDKAISEQQLSQILWATCGINRPEKGLLTIPTAMNAQDVKAYVCTAKGVSLYDAKANTLTSVSKTDIRPMLAEGQNAMAKAPVFILLVSDQTKLRHNGQIYGAMDAGYASQDICLICAALGLKTVPRAMMNKEKVSKELGFPETMVLELNHPIGY